MSSSPIPMRSAKPSLPLLHILSTSALADGEVLVMFADGGSAVYEAEELEKLRPIPKRVFPATATSQRRPFADVA